MNSPIRQSVPSEQGIDITKTSSITCDSCGKEAFQNAFILRKISAIISPTGKDGVIPVQIFSCVACGNVNNEFLPKELRKNKIVT